jgi:hypothetical protein
MLVLGVLSGVCRSAAGAPIVFVSTSIESGGNVVEVGQTRRLLINADITGANSANDGIFTFDLDLIVSNLLPGQSSGLQILGIERPGVSDALLGGSDGSASASGLDAIHGGYLDDTRGVGGSAVLFSVDVLATTPGENSVTPGPSVDPYGFDFVLYQSQVPGVVYGPGVLVTVVPSSGVVPLPAALIPGLVLGSWVVFVGGRARRRASAS